MRCAFSCFRFAPSRALPRPAGGTVWTRASIRRTSRPERRAPAEAMVSPAQPGTAAIPPGKVAARGRAADHRRRWPFLVAIAPALPALRSAACSAAAVGTPRLASTPTRPATRVPAWAALRQRRAARARSVARASWLPPRCVSRRAIASRRPASSCASRTPTVGRRRAIAATRRAPASVPHNAARRAEGSGVRAATERAALRTEALLQLRSDASLAGEIRLADSARTTVSGDEALHAGVTGGLADGKTLGAIGALVAHVSAGVSRGARRRSCRTICVREAIDAGSGGGVADRALTTVLADLARHLTAVIVLTAHVSPSACLARGASLSGRAAVASLSGLASTHVPTSGGLATHAVVCATQTPGR